MEFEPTSKLEEKGRATTATYVHINKWIQHNMDYHHFQLVQQHTTKNQQKVYIKRNLSSITIIKWASITQKQY